eukprot:scaffold348796_cov18-Prasinocladus_malaysianus.AAC.1
MILANLGSLYRSTSSPWILPSFLHWFVGSRSRQTPVPLKQWFTITESLSWGLRIASCDGTEPNLRSLTTLYYCRHHDRVTR